MVAAKVFILLTIIVLGLLSLQAEAVTAVMGWTLAGIYMLALIAQTLKGK